MTSYLVNEAQAGRLAANSIQDLQDSEAGRAAKLKAAPQFIQRSLVGSYVLGQAFLLRGNTSGLTDGSTRPRDLDRAFRTPPSSTEQILHPEKYWDNSSRDLPREVDLPDLSSVLGDDWSLQASGVFGEMILAIVGGSRSDRRYRRRHRAVDPRGGGPAGAAIAGTFTGTASAALHCW